jgi:hypothetical protein
VGWERRGKTGRYYYHWYWINGRATKLYFGAGPAAALAAAKDQDARAKRAAQAAALRAERQRLEQPDQLLVILDSACERLLAAALLAGGFHRYNRHAWRRRGARRQQQGD